MHDVVVPAYGESPYLGDCLDSLLAQSAPCRIRVATSTPTAGVRATCRARGIELVEHGPNRGIGPDWNFALGLAGGGLATLAHQDDIYAPGYAAAMQAAHAAVPGAALFFSDSHEIDGRGARRAVSRALGVKRALARTAFMGSDTVAGGLRLRLLLGLGNAVPCPAATLNLAVLGTFGFREDMRTNMDWHAWLQAARRGPVCHVRADLVGHRVHDASETSRCIADGSRRREDELMFREFWPAPAAALLSRLYTLGYEAQTR